MPLLWRKRLYDTVGAAPRNRRRISRRLQRGPNPLANAEHDVTAEPAARAFSIVRWLDRDF